MANTYGNCIVMLAILTMVASVRAQQEPVTILRASGSPESSYFVLKWAQAASDRANKPSDVIYKRVANTATAQADLLATGTLVDFAVGAGPLSAAQQASLTGGGLNIPFGFHTVSLYVNIPENSVTLNISACVAAKMFSGAITTWGTPDFKDLNPGITLTVNTDPSIVVQTLAATDPATMALKAWLATCPSVWTATSAFPATALLTSNMMGDVMRTPYSLGYALTTQGAAYALNELAVSNKAGAFMLAKSTNTTNVVSALTAQLPATYDLSMAALNTINMAGANVFPILLLDMFYIAKDWTAKGEKGALMQAMATFALTSDGQALLAGTPGMWGVGAASAIAAAVNTTVSSMTLGASITTYTLEGAGSTSNALAAVAGSLSGNRLQQSSVAIADLQNQIIALKAQLARAGTRVLRGSGSSAMGLLLWKLMDEFRGLSSSPVWMTYRAVGSGTGEKEVAGKANEGYAPYTHLGVSDVPMSSTSYNSLKTAGITVVHIPICVSPMSFFVNIPPDSKAAIGGAVKLSACTLAKIFSGSITSWDAPDITADNGGLLLPTKPITFVYRTGSSGTTAVITQYLTQATANQNCASAWALGSANNVPGWTSITNSLAAGSTVEVVQKLVNTTWSIGYSEAGVGQGVGDALVEVSVKNKAGKYVTSLQADVPSAASALFKTNAWPTNPTSDFSSVSIIDQPGDNTWPIASMPMMFVRTDITAAGDSGALLVAFLQYITTPATQTGFTALGLFPLPKDVLAYTVSRALPLLLPDLRSPKWLYETSTNAYNGAADNVFSNPTLAATYNGYSIAQLQTSMTAAQSAIVALQATAGNATSLAAAGASSEATGALAVQLANMNNKIAMLQSVAIAGVAFGIAALLIALFASCKVFVTATTISPINARGQDSVTGMMSGGGVKARTGAMDDGASIKGNPV